MEQFQSLVTVMPWTFIFTICNLLILTWGIKRFLFKPVVNVLEQRQEAIDAQYSEAEKAETSAKQMQAEYEQRLATAKEEATDIVRNATMRAQERGEEMVNTARAEAVALKSKAETEIESERRKAAGELKNDIAGIALDIAGKVVEKEIDEKAHKNLIDTFISGMGDAS